MLPIIALSWRAASVSSTMATGTCVASSAMRAVHAVNLLKVEVRFWRRSLSSRSSPPMAKTSSCVWPFMRCRSAILVARVFVTTRYGLLHYAYLIRRTGAYSFPFNLLNLATPLTTYAVRLVLLILVPLSSLLCYLYDAILILTLDILYSLIDTFLSILRYISTHVFVVEP
jgi:hypothetical protein